MTEPPAVYSYGDTETAGDRLALLAEIFGPTTEAFVRSAAPERAEAVVDLGCGPGFTTRLLADVLHPRTITGIDLSAPFVERAARAHGALHFARHDVTVVPLPGAPADLLFARYLLAHLPDATQVARSWATQLRGTGARLLLEEIETIETEVPVFRSYLDIVIAMAASHGTALLFGPELPTCIPSGPNDRHELAVNRTATIAPSPATVARMFSMNLSVWRHDPYAVEHLAPSDLDTLAGELQAIATGAGGRVGDVGAIVWTHRQVAYEQRAG